MCHEQWALTVIKLLRFFCINYALVSSGRYMCSTCYTHINNKPSILNLWIGFFKNSSYMFITTLELLTTHQKPKETQQSLDDVDSLKVARHLYKFCKLVYSSTASESPDLSRTSCLDPHLEITLRLP